MAETLTKSEFALRRGVDPSAVSHWIKTGKLTGPALVGNGRYAKIDVAVAERQLDVTLDPGQQLAQSAIKRPTASSAPPEPLNPDDDHAARYAKAKADAAEQEVERSRRKLAAEDGLYMVAQAATDAWSKELAALLQAVDQWWPELGRRLALLSIDGQPVDEKRIIVELRRAWREFRAQRAELARSAAEALPELIADDQAED